MDVLVVDYESSDAPERFAESLRETGFGVLKNHPLPQDMVEGIYDEWLSFFRTAEKLKYAVNGQSQDGFFSSAISETAVGFKVKDVKEYFHVFPWGVYPDEVSDAARRYFTLAFELASELLDWIQKASPKSVREGYSMPLPQMIAESPRTLLRVLHYPPLSDDVALGALRAADHEDINLLTVLPAANEPGLEVKDAAGRWHQVPCDHGTLVVNAGDMLKEASGGHFPSTTHRVANPTGPDRHRSRVSLPLFLHPRDEVVLSDRYSAGSYLEERLRQMGVADLGPKNDD